MPNDPTTQRPSDPPTPGRLLRVFLAIGLQSFGGGASTFALIQREVVERRGWLTEAEFARDNALCQLAPGINLLALSTLIGRKLGGAAGIAACLLGLLLPSAAITVAMTAAYVRFESAPSLRPALDAAMRGIVPALVGIAFVTAAGILRPLLVEARQQGRAATVVAGLLLTGSAAALALWPMAVIPTLCAAGLVGGAARMARARAAQAAPEAAGTDTAGEQP